MKSSSARTAVVVVMGLRIAYGVGLLAAPARLARSWLGPAAETAPTQVPLHALGTREVVMHTGIAIAARRGWPVRWWLLGSIAGDLTDVAATLARRSELPGGAALATGLVGGGSALVSGLLALAVDD